MDRLRECRAFGTLAGIATAGIAFWGHFLAQIYRVALEITSPQIAGFPVEYNLVRVFLVLGVFAFALGAGGVAGRWAGEYIIYPVRTGNNATAMKMLTRLMIGGVAVAVLAVVAAVLWQVSMI